MYQLVIFDLDGTILDTLGDLAISANFALRTNGLPERTVDEVRRFVGNGIGKLIERAVPAGTPETVRAQVFADFNAHYAAHCTDHTAPYEGIPALLAALRERGIRTAVVSNKADYAVQELIPQYFPGLFDAAAGERQGVRRKPAPDAVYAVLETLEIPREAAVYIGDSDVDIETAANAGMPCISVEWGFRDRAFLAAHGAKQYASDAAALLAMLTAET